MNRGDGLHVNVTKSETVLSAVEETHQQGSKLRERRIKVKLDLVFFSPARLVQFYFIMALNRTSK